MIYGQVRTLRQTYRSRNRTSMALEFNRRKVLDTLKIDIYELSLI